MTSRLIVELPSKEGISTIPRRVFRRAEGVALSAATTSTEPSAFHDVTDKYGQTTINPI